MEIANTYVVLPALNPERKIDVQELIAYARSEGNVIPLEQAPRPNQPLSRLAEPASLGPCKERGALGAEICACASIAAACITAACWPGSVCSGIRRTRRILENGASSNWRTAPP